jgi:hypothetical protein
MSIEIEVNDARSEDTKVNKSTAGCCCRTLTKGSMDSSK